MRTRLVRPCAAALLAVATVAACDNSPTAPDPAKAATQAADRFDHLADSLSGAGSYDEADFAQTLADLIRVVGRVDRVVVKIGGRSVTHSTLGVETLTASNACSQASDVALCNEQNPPFQQVVIGWTGTDLKEGFFASSTVPGVASAFYDGTTNFPPGEVIYSVRDANGLDTDLFGADARVWYSDDGTVTMNAGTRGAACQLPAGLTPGASFSCSLATFSPSFNVTASEYTGSTAASQTITMAPQRVDGLSVTVTQAFDPGAFDVARATTTAAARQQRRQSALAAGAMLRRVAPVFLGRSARR